MKFSIFIFVILSFLLTPSFTFGEDNPTKTHDNQVKTEKELLYEELKQEMEQEDDNPKKMIMKMLDFSLDDGGVNHESEIEQTRLQIENSPKLIKGDKKSARPINDKGLAFLKDSDFINAVKMFEEANNLDKSDIEIASNLGYSYLKQGNLDLAEKTIVSALSMSPARASAWESLGRVFALKGDLNKAEACFSNTFRFSKDRVKTYKFLEKLNENESSDNLKQARIKTISWAEKTYLHVSTNNQENAVSKNNFETNENGTGLPIGSTNSNNTAPIKSAVENEHLGLLLVIIFIIIAIVYGHMNSTSYLYGKNDKKKAVVTKCYRGNQSDALTKFNDDAVDMDKHDYHPTSQAWSQDSRGCLGFMLIMIFWFIVASIFSLVFSPIIFILIGLIVVSYMVIVKPDGSLSVVYELRKPTPTISTSNETDEKVCPKCAETIKAAAIICRYCGYEFIYNSTPTNNNGTI